MAKSWPREARPCGGARDEGHFERAKGPRWAPRAVGRAAMKEAAEVDARLSGSGDVQK